MKKVLTVIGARPQFIKHALMQVALQKVLKAETLHTGQHYDPEMSQVFFDELNIPAPDYQLNISGGGHGQQTGRMLEQIEQVLTQSAPDAILLYGDTNSTLAGALAAAKLYVPVIHIEAGLRSFNQTMPEEVNRVLTDHVSALLFCPTQTAIDNLKREGIEKGVIYCGDVMYDMVRFFEQRVSGESPRIEPYYYVTLHRPYNTDIAERLAGLLNVLNKLPHRAVFAIHPRTQGKMKAFGLTATSYPNIDFIPPQGYVDNLRFQKHAVKVITDSGGVQKEAYWLRKPCITVRSETEWVETLRNNWNQLVFEKPEEILGLVDTQPGPYVSDLFGDGQSVPKIVADIVGYLNK